MAQTSYGVNDALAVKLWARRLEYDLVYRTDISALIGEDPNSIIHLKKETAKSSGDQVTFGLQKELDGDGFTEGEVAEGNGESLSQYSDKLLINELGHLVDIPNAGRSIDAQRVPYNLRKSAKIALKTWKAKRMSEVFFNHMCGYTPANEATEGQKGGPKYNGNNTILAPTRHLFVDAGNNNSDGDENLASDDVMSLRYIDYAREMAETADSPLRPINVEGVGENGRDISGGKYVMYLHPFQATDLRTNTENGQWLDIQKAALSAKDDSNNPIYTDALGEYNNVILKKANHVRQGVDSSTGDAISTVRRAALMGAQAAGIGFGKDGGKNAYGWNEELIDHKRRLEVSMMSIFGMKKLQFDGQDFGVVNVSSYAVAHT